MKIGVPGQKETPTNSNYNNEPTWGCRRFYIDHLLFAESGSYRRLLAWVIEPYVHRVGRLHLSFKCSGGCCGAMDAGKDAAWLLSGKGAAAWMRQA